MKSSRYQQIYAIVRQIPPGKVASYGQIAKLVDKCTARMVGYAMHAIGPEDGDVPWQRVINSQGRISSHGDGIGTCLQRQMLEEEGVIFDHTGRTDLKRFGWLGTNLIGSQQTHSSKRHHNDP
ncbi:MAG: MGMT family protein [Anaerolineaceae bacterium]|nr:MGMT family protein [Anaerolineaceae bacterium]